MPWFAFHGANSYVADVPTAADARSEAHDTGTTETGPYATQAAAQAALGGKAPAPSPGGGSGQWWVVIKSGSSTMTVLQSASKPAGYATVFGPFPTRAAAQKIAGIAPEPPHLGITGNPSVPGGLTAIGDFFTKIGDRATWVRVAKVVIGAIMIIAGLAKLGTPAAEKIAAKLPKVIPV
jgi:hypothetical protein